MKWNIDYLAEEGVVRVQYEGRLAHDPYRESVREGLEVSRTHGVDRFLVDNTRLEPALDATDIYAFPDIYESLSLPRESIIAVVNSDHPAIRRNIAFFETVCVNRGYLVKVFDDEASALAWLRRGA